MVATSAPLSTTTPRSGLKAAFMGKSGSVVPATASTTRFSTPTVQMQNAVPAANFPVSEQSAADLTSLDTKLSVLDQILTDVENKRQATVEVPAEQPVFESVPNPTQTLDATALASAVPAAIDQAYTQVAQTVATQSGTTSTSKEAIQAASPEWGAGLQVVEHETSPEIPVEVEAFLKKAQDDAQVPAEITIAGDQILNTPVKKLPATPVVVLPITAEEENAGAKKSPLLSIRWLVEFSRKIMKMFSGRVIYRQS